MTNSLSLNLHVLLYTRILADGFGCHPDPIYEGDARSLGERGCELVTAALRRAYPHAEIDVTWTTASAPCRHRVAVGTDHYDEYGAPRAQLPDEEDVRFLVDASLAPLYGY